MSLDNPSRLTQIDLNPLLDQKISLPPIIIQFAQCDGDNILEDTDFNTDQCKQLIEKDNNEIKTFDQARKLVIQTLTKDWEAQILKYWPNASLDTIINIILVYGEGIKNYVVILQKLKIAIFKQIHPEHGYPYINEKGLYIFILTWLTLAAQVDLYQNWLNDENPPITIFAEDEPKQNSAINDYAELLTKSVERWENRDVQFGVLDKSVPTYAGIQVGYDNQTNTILFPINLFNDPLLSNDQALRTDIINSIPHEFTHAEQDYSNRPPLTMDAEIEGELIELKSELLRKGLDITVTDTLNGGSPMATIYALKKDRMNQIFSTQTDRYWWLYVSSDQFLNNVTWPQRMLTLAKEEMSTGKINKERRKQCVPAYAHIRLHLLLTEGLFPFVDENFDQLLIEEQIDLETVTLTDLRQNRKTYEDINGFQDLIFALVALVLALKIIDKKFGGKAAQTFFNEEFIPIYEDIIHPKYMELKSDPDAINSTTPE